MKITHPVTRAAFGVAALVVIAILANWLVSLISLGNRGADFTEKKVHTLSDGTRAILSELDTPVTIRYYATRSTDYMPQDMKIHMRRVDDLLEEYAYLSNGNLRIENLDPEPDTDAEDSANLDGISGQQIDDQNLYFGLAISCLDRTAVIPVLDPRDETMLEYHLSKAIAEVSTAKKPRIGMMSGISMQGGPPTMPGQPPSRPWVIYQQLKRSYELVDIPMQNPELDPRNLKVLIVYHPANITPEAEFAIDQYVLGGGTVIACLDAYSVAAQMIGGGGNPMMGMPGPPTSSTLPTLLKNWGISFESNRVLADPKYATQLAGGRDGLAVLTLPSEAMPGDSVVTRDIQNVTFFLPGAFTKDGNAGLTTTSLIRSSANAGFVDSMRASRLDKALTTEFRSSGSAYDLVTHLSGTFKTAFSDGDPAKVAEEESAATDEGEDAKQEAEEEQPDPSLKESSSPGNVFLIGDIDAFYDQFAFNPQLLQMGLATPVNGNASLFFNIVDQAVGSKHLMGSRSRAAVNRPFTVIQEMEAKFNEEVGQRIADFEEKRLAAQQRLQELQARRADSNSLIASPEQEAEIRKLQEEGVEYSKLIREEQKDLQRQKDKLSGKVILLNVVLMPVIVVLFGLSLFVQRRRSTRAR